MSAKVSNCGHDENGKYSGGSAGDQTGTEYQIKAWYNYSGGWTTTFRWKKKKYAKKFAKICKQAAKNNKIGYDQSYDRDSGKKVGGRMSYYEQMKKVGWKPSKIKTKCECDCSQSTTTNLIALGKRLGIESLKNISEYQTTSTLKSVLRGTKLFEEVSVTSEAYAKIGDINLKEGHHVNVTVKSGAKA